MHQENKASDAIIGLLAFLFMFAMAASPSFRHNTVDFVVFIFNGK